MRNVGCGLVFIFFAISSFAQVDTSYIYNNNMPYGSLDIRIAKSPTNYYYLQEGKTFSFRESGGSRTDTYLDMTSWDSGPYVEGNLREKSSTQDLFVMNYRMLIPENYSASYNPGYPMIVLLHGLGESANCWKNICHHADQNWSPIANDPPAPTDSDNKLLNNDHQLTNGGYQHLKARNDAAGKLPDDESLSSKAFPGFVLFPQNLNGWDVLPIHDVIRIVRLVAKKYNIDENRIYITGLSNGGQGAYEAAKRAPWLFSSLLTMSAIGDANIHVQNQASTIAHIPMWTFQGGQDQNPLPSKTENYIKQFRDAGALVRYTKYENIGHGTWNTAFGEPDYFSWLLQGNKANIHSFAGSTTICQSEGLKLELAPGFRAYQWERNGQIIAGANSATYAATTEGTYRARFSRVANPSDKDWNKWSEPVKITAGQGVPQAVIKQEGTTLLNDLNNNTNALLSAEGDFGHYYWYKDGTLVDFPGTQDDTIKHAVITPAMGKGIYTLVVSNFDNCKSPVSEGKSVIFNNQAPATITAPSNFSGKTKSASEIDLTWSDQSSNETGFEIWRRRKLEESNFTPWVMATITTANKQSFQDTGLFPSSTYQYKIRAVSSTARSNYTPSPENEFLVLVTSPDNEAPTTPENFSIKTNGVQSFKLMWSPATDDTGIRRYVAYYNADSIYVAASDTVVVLSNLKFNTDYQFRVRAVDLAGNYSAPSDAWKSTTAMSGLFYQHSTGATLTLDSIDWTKPEFTGMVHEFSLSPKTQDDFFNFRFDGYLLITNAGTYQFRISSDDGSRLRLDGAVIVDNNGQHGFRTVTGANRSLATGAHRINVDYFDFIEEDSLLVEYKGPDTNNSWARITIDVLKSSESVVTAVEPEPGPEDQFVLHVYPNPTSSDNINLEIRTLIKEPLDIELLNAVGKRVFHQSHETLDEHVQLASGQTLSPGLYFVRVKQAGKIITKRLLIKP